MQYPLIRQAKEALGEMVKASEDLDMLVFVGLPWERDGKLYNVAAAVCGGKLLGLVQKRIFRIILSFMNFATSALEMTGPGRRMTVPMERR